MEEICLLTENKGGREMANKGMEMVTEYVKVDNTPVLWRGYKESPPLQHKHPKMFYSIYTNNAASDFTCLAALSYVQTCGPIIMQSLGMLGILHSGENN